jgi:hypothetical protein
MPHMTAANVPPPVDASAMVVYPVGSGAAVVAGDNAIANTAADVTVDATAGGVELLAANVDRKGFIITVGNASSAATDAVRIRIGDNPTASTGIRLVAGQSWTWISDGTVGVPTGQIKAIREGANSVAVSVTELTFDV